MVLLFIMQKIVLSTVIDAGLDTFYMGVKSFTLYAQEGTHTFTGQFFLQT